MSWYKFYLGDLAVLWTNVSLIRCPWFLLGKSAHLYVFLYLGMNLRLFLEPVSLLRYGLHLQGDLLFQSFNLSLHTWAYNSYGYWRSLKKIPMIKMKRPPLPSALCFHLDCSNLPSAPRFAFSASVLVLSSPSARYGPLSGSLHAKQLPCGLPSYFGKRWTLQAPLVQPPPPHLSESGVLCFPCWWIHSDHEGVWSAAPAAPSHFPALGFLSLLISGPCLCPRFSSQALTELPGK